MTRTRAAGFGLEDSLRLDEIEKLAQEGAIEPYILPLEAALLSYPAIYALPEADGLVHNGNPCFRKNIRFSGSPEQKDGQLFRMYDSHGGLIGIYEYRQEKHFWKPRTMLLT